MPAPKGYIAGLGRGATGFTTQADLGTGRLVSGGDEAGRGEDENEGREAGGWEGEESGAFGESSEDFREEDEEADKIYEMIDERMDSKRKRRRDEKYLESLRKFRKANPTLSQQFADLREELVTLSEDEWKNIPDEKDRSIKRRKVESYYRTPDTLIESARHDALSGRPVDGSISAASATPSSLVVPGAGGSASTSTDFRAVSEARGALVGMKLRAESERVGGQTVVDPMSYISGLNSMRSTSFSEIEDIKKVRQIFRSVIRSNPSHSRGWIALALLEEQAGRTVAARNVINEACEKCPKTDDVWLQAARLHPPEKAKIILATAVRHVPQSVNVWIEAGNLENDVTKRKAVLRKALEFIPNSVKIWKTLIDLEKNPEEARILLSHAVECIPRDADMWIALAKLETYENARRVLNRAREFLPSEPLIWITAAQLSEANKDGMTSRIIVRAVGALQASKVQIGREKWLEYAQQCEASGFVETCGAIVESTIDLALEEEHRENTWVADAKRMASAGSVETARFIFSHATGVYPNRAELWKEYAEFESSHAQNSSESLKGKREGKSKENDEMEESNVAAVLKKAVACCPQAENLWLMAARERMAAGDASGARRVLQGASFANPRSEEILVQAVLLEAETQEFDRARLLLARAREHVCTARVWIKSAALERQLGCSDDEVKLLEEGLEKFPDNAQLWLMRAQWAEAKQMNGMDVDADTSESDDSVLTVLRRATKLVPMSVPLWRMLIRHHCMRKEFAKARAVLERAQRSVPRNDELWLEGVRIEDCADDQDTALFVLSRGMQECPESGLLWAETIERAEPAKKRMRATDAIRKCQDSGPVVVAVARFFWWEGKPDKARKWFMQSVRERPDNGDAWAHYLRFEMEQKGKPGNTLLAADEDVIARCMRAKPMHGELWTSITKDRRNATISGCLLTTDSVLRIAAEKVVPPR